jgi:hypothetical protein
VNTEMNPDSVSYKGVTYTLHGLMTDKKRTIKDFVALDNKLRKRLKLPEIKSFKHKNAAAVALYDHLVALAVREAEEPQLKARKTVDRAANVGGMRKGRGWYVAHEDRKIKIAGDKFKGPKEGHRWEYRQKFAAYMNGRAHLLKTVRAELGPSFGENLINFIKYEIKHGRVVFVD